MSDQNDAYFKDGQWHSNAAGTRLTVDERVGAWIRDASDRAAAERIEAVVLKSWANGRAELAAEVRVHLEAEIAKLTALRSAKLVQTWSVEGRRAALVDMLAWITEKETT